MGRSKQQGEVGLKDSAMAAAAVASGRGGVRGRGGEGEEGSLARRAWRQYLRQLQLHPLRTKVRSCFAPRFDWFSARAGLFAQFLGDCVQMITAGCLAGVSDSVAQKLSGYQRIEKRRLLLKMVRTCACASFLPSCGVVAGLGKGGSFS